MYKDQETHKSECRCHAYLFALLAHRTEPSFCNAWSINCRFQPKPHNPINHKP